MTTANTAGLSPEAFAALSPVDQAIAIAKYQATNVSPAPVTDVAVVNHSTAVAMPPAGRKMSMDDPLPGMVVDGFLKVSYFGLEAGKGNLVKTIKAKMVASNERGFTRNLSIKFGQNPVNYVKTYDEARTADGKSWQAELDRISRIDPNAKPYPAADLVFTLLEDAGGFKAGTTVGYTTATTSFKHAVRLKQDIEAAGLWGIGAEVEVEIGFAPIEKKGNKYGEMTFRFMGPAK